jgi:transposase-like protein
MLGGRPSKLTPEVVDRVVQAVEAGASVGLAAAHAGIAQSTLFKWLADGEPRGGSWSTPAGGAGRGRLGSRCDAEAKADER